MLKRPPPPPFFAPQCSITRNVWHKSVMARGQLLSQPLHSGYWMLHHACLPSRDVLEGCSRGGAVACCVRWTTRPTIAPKLLGVAQREGPALALSQHRPTCKSLVGDASHINTHPIFRWALGSDSHRSGCHPPHCPSLMVKHDAHWHGTGRAHHGAPAQ